MSGFALEAGQVRDSAGGFGLLPFDAGRWTL